MHKRKTLIKYNPDLETMSRKKRVCAYARVSSDRDEAFHSLSAQISYYQKIIAEHLDWEFVEVFADRGITGTKETREGFQRMLTACRNGEIDIVLTKSISRFARNTVILLETIRELKGLEVDIRFEEERINTLSEEGEFMLSILAARAQEESRSASENQKWKIQKSFEKGIPVTGNCMGYRMVDHQFLIEENEAGIVRCIFDMYLSGIGITAIVNILNEEKVPSYSGKEWQYETVRGILDNKKYAGILVLGKYYKTDHITKKKAINRGERPMYIVDDAHDAIIPKEDFEKAQKLRAEKAEKYSPHDTPKRYPFTRLITCGKCGKSFSRKVSTNTPEYAKPVWICRTFNTLGKARCDAQQIPEKILSEITCKTLGLESLEDIDLKTYLQKIIVPEKNTLTYIFRDGSEKTINWQNPSRRESWTPEMREQARRRAIAQKNKKQKGGPHGT